jgi:hypothetical protein
LEGYVATTKDAYEFKTATKCLQVHLEDRECDEQHSLSDGRALDESIAAKIIRRQIKGRLYNLVDPKVKFLKIGFDDFTQVSSNKCTYKLWAYLFSILRSDDAQEVVIVDRTIQSDDGTVGLEHHQIKLEVALADGTKLPTLGELKSMEKKQKQDTMLSIFNANSLITNKVEEHVPQNLREQFRVLLILAKFVFDHCEDHEVKQLHPIIGSYLINMLIQDKPKELYALPPFQYPADFEPKHVHINSKFQAVVHIYEQINGILDYPFTSLQCSKWLGGDLVYNLSYSITAGTFDESLMKLDPFCPGIVDSLKSCLLEVDNLFCENTAQAKVEG